MLWVRIIKLNSKAGLEHCVALKKLEWYIAYRISGILHFTTFQKKRSAFFQPFKHHSEHCHQPAYVLACHNQAPQPGPRFWFTVPGTLI